MNPNCPSCGAARSVKFGRYQRAEDAQSIQRYRCLECGKCHSSATHTPTYRQKRRRLNQKVLVAVGSSTAQRRIAINLGCTRKTVARKIAFLAEQSRIKTEQWLREQGPFGLLEWDELITFEHSRLKPLSVAVMCCRESRCIIGYGIAEIPCSGRIAKRSVEKYGKRKDKSGPMRKRVLTEVAEYILPEAIIKSDQHDCYGREIKTAFPKAKHLQYRSKRGSLTGQGELKRTGFDPLFGINHSLAMMRDNIKPLTRRTWCTTKKASKLLDLIAVYVYYHNTVLIQQPLKKRKRA